MSNTKGTSVINNPQGGGAQSGLGEKFSPDLFTGTGNFSVPIAVPPGRNGFQPELALGYSSGNGNGPFGMGWALGVPGVSRKTSKGISVYSDEEDIFILSGAEDLVPIRLEQETIVDPNGNIGWQRTYYRPRTEGLFAKIIRHKKTNGEHCWEVRSKDGLTSWYGTPGYVASGAPNDPGDPATVANPENRAAIFSWLLSKTVDTFGNEILYTYERTLVQDPGTGANRRSYDQLYLSRIHYAFYPDGVPAVMKPLCEVQFHYEERPDPFSTYKQGFEVRTTRRCTHLELHTHPGTSIKTKTYHFNYQGQLPLNGASLLASVEVEGHNGSESERMPPLSFGYSVFDPAQRQLQEVSGPLPVNPISEPGFELVDVNGNGLPDLLQLNGTARYWTNLGNGRFGSPRPMGLSPSVQLGAAGVRLIDANGDGRTDLLVNNGLMNGYFAGAFGEVWDAKGFRPYSQSPSFSFDDPEVQLIDLDGDGVTDVLRNGAKFECFYNDPQKGFYKVRTASKTFTGFSFADPCIRFADMTGDGLQDIVLIRSGRVQYWPNLGYGRFGAKINMTNAPVFPEQYDPAQILLGDLDGDGQADIAFVEMNRVTLYVNRSGNGFSDPVRIHNTPRVYNVKALRITDLMGTGQAGVLWSFGADAGTAGRMFFLDFTKGNKPYVLQEMNNNMGSLTRVSYGSSVYHYLRDQKQAATRWKTTLPFPVQVVNRVEVFDFLSGGRLTTEYDYHNGYWDGVEREFRGFAHVDSRDTETFQNTAPALPFPLADTPMSQNPQTVSPSNYAPPVLTKSWFYVGPVGDAFGRWREPDYSDEYWQGEAGYTGSGEPVFLERPPAMSALLAALPRRARRDALRTLRGSLLHSELYALDGSPRQALPYTVTESRMSLRTEFDPTRTPPPYAQTHRDDSGYVFFPFNVGQRTTHYERGNDPQHNFSFTRSYDAFGQARGQLSIGVPRGASPAGGGNGDYLATYSLSDYITLDTANRYMVTRVCRSLSWDLTQAAAGKSVFALRDQIFAENNDESNPYTVTWPVIACTLSYYDGPAFDGEPFGEIGLQGALVRSEQLIITPDIVSAAYGGSTPQCFLSAPDWTTPEYPPAFDGQLQNSDPWLGYKDYTAPSHRAPGWYTEGPRSKYDFQDGALQPQEKLGRLLETRDVFESWQTIEYDSYYLLPEKSHQYLLPYGAPGNSSLDTEANYDYRVMQPYRVKDINLNYSVFDFSPLGLLRATALIGKGTEGDYKSNSGGYYDRYAPSVRMDYDFFSFVNNLDPVWVKTMSREQHYQTDPASNTITKVEYSDGFGRLLQTRVQAEDLIFGSVDANGQGFGDSGLPVDQTAANADAVALERGGGDPLNVVVSGWKIYNNKGKAVRQYEPYFDKDFDYSLNTGTGRAVNLFYDALGRVERTVNPDNSQQLVVYGIPLALNTPAVFLPSPWESYTYDADDLAPQTNGVSFGCDYTPKSTLIDALGRSTRTTEHLGTSADDIVMNYRYDIRGNLLLVKDPYDRTVFSHVYDLRSPQKDQPLPPIRTQHIDKGLSTVLYDAAGKPIESYDAKGAHALSAYDALARPIDSWATNNSGTTTPELRTHINYGDSAGLVNPQLQNLRGKAYETYDEAGLLLSPEYDFKGNLLSKTRYVIDTVVLKAQLAGYNNFVIDCTGFPALLDLGQSFQSDMEYDALNRVTLLRLPTDVAGNRQEILPVYNRAGVLTSVSCDGTTYVEHIAYSAKGQRLLIAYGNGTMTRYAYDPNTFRLLRYRSEGYLRSQVGNTITYAYQSGTNRQDDAFHYDLVGNMLRILQRVTDCGITGSTLGANALNRTFTYDAIYRLKTADGRESNSQNQNNYLYTDAPAPGSPNANNVRSYGHTYSYDKLGNVQQMVQSGSNGFTRNFVYNTGVNSLSRINDGASVLIESYTYDANANQTKAGTTRNYVWNHADQLLGYFNKVGSANPTVFTQYDYAGQDRVSKLVRSGNNYERTIYIDGVFEYVKLETLSITYEKNYIHVMDDQMRVAEIRVNIGTAFPGDIADAITYSLGDQVGSSYVRLTTTGSVIDKEEYYPFGDSSLRTFTYKRYRYVGKERDAESGLYYYGARYYAAWTCRFISVDPLAMKTAFQSAYAYANNNPIKLNDPTGMEAENPQSSENIEPKSNDLPNTTEPTKENPTTEKTDINKTGEAWKHKHKWNDVITDKKDIKKYGDGFEKGKTTYKDLYEKIAPKILGDKLAESQEKGLKMDCADLVLNTLVDFASEFGLPVYIKDYRPDGKTFDSTSTSFKSKTEFAQALKNTFGAATLFSEANKALNTIDWNDIQPGDIMTWKFYIWPLQDESSRSWHANTITDVTKETITVIQGSLSDNSATEIGTKTYDRESSGKVDGPWDIKEVKARRWNFNSFDKRK